MQFPSLVYWHFLLVHGLVLTSCDIVEFEKFEPPTGSWGRQPIVSEENGGLTNLLVAIHEDVEESYRIIDGIKEIFTMTSRLLYSMTTGTMYFKSVSILVPNSWEESSTYERSRPNDTFQTARIIIRNETSKGLPPSCPFVRQLDSSEGEYVYLPSGMLLPSNESLKNESTELLLSLTIGLLCGLKAKYEPTREIEQSSASTTFCDKLWQEIMKNSDEVHNYNSDVNTTFRVLNQSDIMAVIILDERQCMKEYNKCDQMREAFENFVWHVIPTNSYVGAVLFNDTIYSIRKIFKFSESPYSRRAVTQNYHEFVIHTNSSLQGAVKYARKMISEQRENISGSYIFIMSDALDISPAFNGTMQKLISEGVVVASIPFSSNTSENIKLANTITTNFKKEVTDRVLFSFDDERRFVRHLRLNLQLEPLEWVSVNCSMEDSSMNTVIVRIHVQDPQNQQYLHFQYYQEDEWPMEVDEDYEDILNLTVRDIEILEYPIQRFELISNISQNVSLEVFSAIMYETVVNEPVHIRAIMESDVVNYTSSKGSIPLYTSVTKNEHAVLKVSTVTAVVTNSDGAISTLQLNDDGTGADLESFDGISSNFFKSFTAEGEYEVQINVDSGQEPCLSESLNELCFSDVSQLSNNSEIRNCTLLVPLQRVPTSFKFTVIGIPPSKVNDLKAEIRETSKRSVLLSWTTVGEDLMIGEAHQYEIRYGKTESDITENFDSSKLLQNILVDNSNGSGTRNGHIKLDTNFSKKEGADLFLAVRAVDRGGNKGDVSNVVHVEFPEQSASVIKKSVGMETYIVVFIAAILICFLIVNLILMARVNYLKRRQNRVLSEISLDALRPNNHYSTSGDLAIVSI